MFSSHLEMVQSFPSVSQKGWNLDHTWSQGLWHKTDLSAPELSVDFPRQIIPVLPWKDFIWVYKFCWVPDPMLHHGLIFREKTVAAPAAVDEGGGNLRLWRGYNPTSSTWNVLQSVQTVKLELDWFWSIGVWFVSATGGVLTVKPEHNEPDFIGS